MEVVGFNPWRETPPLLRLQRSSVNAFYTNSVSRAEKFTSFCAVYYAGKKKIKRKSSFFPENRSELWRVLFQTQLPPKACRSEGVSFWPHFMPGINSVVLGCFLVSISLFAPWGGGRRGRGHPVGAALAPPLAALSRGAARRARMRGGRRWRRCWAGPRGWGWRRSRAGGGSCAAGRERERERALCSTAPRPSTACPGGSARISAPSGPSPPTCALWWTTARLFGKKTQVKQPRCEGRRPLGHHGALGWRCGAPGLRHRRPQSGAVGWAPQSGVSRGTPTSATTTTPTFVKPSLGSHPKSRSQRLSPSVGPCRSPGESSMARVIASTCLLGLPCFVN